MSDVCFIDPVSRQPSQPLSEAGQNRYLQELAAGTVNVMVHCPDNFNFLVVICCTRHDYTVNSRRCPVRQVWSVSYLVSLLCMVPWE